MCFRHFGIDLNTKPGFILNREVTVFPDGALMDNESGPPLDPVGEFVYAEVAHGGSSMGRGDGTDRAGGIVRGGPDSVTRCEVGDALRFEQATGFRDIDVNAVAAL